MRMPLTIRFIWTCCLSLLAMAHEGAFAGAVSWPELAKVGHVAGRTATTDDVKAGHAAFAIRSDANGQPGSKPIQVTIPQYALYVDRDTGKQVPVVLIQAEDRAGVKLAGFRLVGIDGFGACLLSELHLLGTKRPS
jgi:hypothetical protein